MVNEEIYDATIVGGSFAGLSAATYLGRARRRVLVVDAGAPRNRFAHASHGFFGRDGHAPLDMIATARAQVAAYPTVRFVDGRVTTVTRSTDGFVAALDDGSTATSRKIVLASGITDVLPDLPGVHERWGASVLHCPYCHGFEVAGQRLGVLAASERGVHMAELITDWGPVTLFTNGVVALDDHARAILAARGVAIEEEVVVGLEGPSPALAGVRLAGGRLVAIDALFIGAPTRLNSSIAEQLGCAIDEGAIGPSIRVDGNGLTTVPGVYAAGDIARGRHSIAWAVADGVTAAVSAHQSLVFPT